MADTFTITGITKTVALEPGRHAGPALEVAFVTKPHDIAGSVTIPAATFTTDEVQRAVTAQAAVLEQIMAL